MDAKGSESIRGTVLRRLLTLIAVKLCRRWRPRSGTVLMLSCNICVKYGNLQCVTEAATMEHIAKHTTIPVPKVYCAFNHKGITYIVMERLDGEYLGKGWCRRSEESKAEILSQLRNMVSQMRAIPQSTDVGIANVKGGSLYDGRLPAALKGNRFGPFPEVAEFHRYLRRGVDSDSTDLPEIGQLIEKHGEKWPICFTHGDLSSLNILARGDKVTGIVDWETAGWYPSYWEYTSAWNVNPQNEFWRNEINKFIDSMPEELAMDQLRLKYFGEFT